METKELIESNNNNNNPTMPVAVDLGLPSGRLWADRNVGADRPEDDGLYFSWGSTKGVRYGEECDFSMERYEQSKASKITNDLERDDDAAFVNLGGPWRMPTSADFLELKKYCHQKWTERNGVEGMLFTSKANKNSIFLPASGVGVDHSWWGRGVEGYYSSRTFYLHVIARVMTFISFGVNPKDGYCRKLGFTVRPVQY